MKENKMSNEQILSNYTHRFNLPWKPDDIFYSQLAQGDFDLDIIGVPEMKIPLSSQYARENLYYIQIYSRSGKAGATHYTFRKNLNSYQLLYTKGGSGFLNYEGKSYHLTTNSCFLIDCRKQHYYYTSDEAFWSYDTIHFDGFHLESLYNIFAEFKNAVVTIKPHSHLSDHFDKLWELCSQNTIYVEVSIHQLLTTILVEFIQFHQQENLPSIPNFVAQVQDYVAENYTKTFTLGELAKTLHLDKYYLCHEYKRYIGTTIMETLRNIRLNQAKQLLITTSLPISEIALCVGYNNVNYFYRVFYKSEKTTPLNYRKQWNTFKQNTYQGESYDQN